MPRKIKLIIDSDLENIPLVGMTINKLCSLTSFSDQETFQIELCAVEAVTNSIKHAYGYNSVYQVEIVFALSSKELTLDVYDTGTPLEKGLLEKRSMETLGHNTADPDNIPDGGRGLAIIQTIMDSVVYKSEKGKNCFTMKKKLA
ncbi:MAG: ATP-binding protein [Thermodesulfobacteriota bacterium]|nr:ATP-binding protein [Thermodesulfobacteriota bacterium]